jgi:predicted acyl esterase
LLGYFFFRLFVSLYFHLLLPRSPSDYSHVRPLNNLCLTYDLRITDRALVLAGVVLVELLVRVNASAANFFLRIDDVWPDDSATHVTGGTQQ